VIIFFSTSLISADEVVIEFVINSVGATLFANVLNEDEDPR